MFQQGGTKLNTPIAPLSARELAEVEQANQSDRRPVVFVHGLWLLPSSWDPWRSLFEERGYSTLAPDWPDDPATVEEARAHPEIFAGKTINTINNHIVEVIKQLNTKPAIVGHSFGGLITQKLAGQGLASVSVPIDPAPFRGVLPLPVSALKSAFPVLRNPSNRKKAIMLTEDQFRFAFANAVDEKEAKELYEKYPVPGSGAPLFEAAFANIDPRTEAKVDYKATERGPMKFISGGVDHTVPWALTNAAYKKQKGNAAKTEIQEIHSRGHSLVIDSGWQDVAEIALDFIGRH
jgi:non-heme chloroperoxidase